jgi:hypothetical protein
MQGSRLHVSHRKAQAPREPHPPGLAMRPETATIGLIACPRCKAPIGLRCLARRRVHRARTDAASRAALASLLPPWHRLSDDGQVVLDERPWQERVWDDE